MVSHLPALLRPRFGRAPGSKFEKRREFRRSFKGKKLRTLYAFPTFVASSSIFTSLIESWCIVFVGNQILFGTKFK